jgi:predicted nucleic acid-binding protein
MRVVSNTSPINNLASVNQLSLLQQLYKTIIIPEAVYRELTTVPVAGTQEVQTLSWLKKQNIIDTELLETLNLELDRGEAEAITLAIEIKADLLLIDERLGRIVASRLGIEFTGVLGILLEAKSKGLITTVKPLLDQLRISGFWMREKLYHQVLNLANE